MAKIERKSFRNEGYDIFTCDYICDFENLLAILCYYLRL